MDEEWLAMGRLTLIRDTSDLALWALIAVLLLMGQILFSVARQQLCRSRMAYVSAVQDWRIGLPHEGSA